jgi:hypothetical protein
LGLSFQQVLILNNQNLNIYLQNFSYLKILLSLIHKLSLQIHQILFVLIKISKLSPLKQSMFSIFKVLKL